MYEAAAKMQGIANNAVARLRSRADRLVLQRQAKLSAAIPAKAQVVPAPSVKKPTTVTLSPAATCHVASPSGVRGDALPVVYQQLQHKHEESKAAVANARKVVARCQANLRRVLQEPRQRPPPSKDVTKALARVQVLLFHQDPHGYLASLKSLEPIAKVGWLSHCHTPWSCFFLSVANVVDLLVIGLCWAWHRAAR